MRPPSNVPLIADSRFCFSEKPFVSAAKIGAMPSGSMITSKVTNALNTNSIEHAFTLQRGARIRNKTPLAPERPRPIHGLFADLSLRSPVPSARLHRERPHHRRNVGGQVPDALGAERQP